MRRLDRNWFSPVTLRSDNDQSFPDRLEACRVENGHGTFRTMRITPIATLVVAVLLGASLWLVAPLAIGSALSPWEAFVVATVILALVAWWRERRLRRE